MNDPTVEPASTSESLAEKQAARKSNVRVYVTYVMAGLYVAMVGAITGTLLFRDDTAGAIEFFNVSSPLILIVVTFWFATRGQSVNPSTDKESTP